MKTWRQSILFSAALLIVFLVNASSQNAIVPWSSVNMGYADQKTGNTRIQSVAGQNFVGSSLQANTQIISGFLADTSFRSVLVAVKPDEALPDRYSLAQNYPNPFNPATTVHFEIPKQSHVLLRVYNLLGQDVMTVMDEEKVAGGYDVRINGSSLSSGVYFYRLEAGDFAQTRKLVIVK